MGNQESTGNREPLPVGPLVPPPRPVIEEDKSPDLELSALKSFPKQTELSPNSHQLDFVSRGKVKCPTPLPNTPGLVSFGSWQCHLRYVKDNAVATQEVLEKTTEETVAVVARCTYRMETHAKNVQGFAEITKEIPRIAVALRALQNRIVFAQDAAERLERILKLVEREYSAEVALE